MSCSGEGHKTRKEKGEKAIKTSFPQLSEARDSDPQRRVSGLEIFLVLMSHSQP